MRFNSSSFMVAFGLVAAACAAPTSGDYNVRNLESAERHEVRNLVDSFFPREFENLDSRAGGKSVTFAEVAYGHELSITFETLEHPSKSPPPHEEVAKKILDHLTEADILKLHEPKLKFTNQWMGSAYEIWFTFSVPICQGKCRAQLSVTGLRVWDEAEKKIYSS